MNHSIFNLCAAVALTVSFSSTTIAQTTKPIYLNTYAKEMVLPTSMEQVSHVSLSRYLFSGYNTVCIPFTLTAQEVVNAFGEVKIERLVSCSQTGNTLNLDFAECTDQGIQAGQAYLIYAPKAVWAMVKLTDTALFNAEIYPTTVSDQQGNKVSFQGIYKKSTGEGLYGIPVNMDADGMVEANLISTDASKKFLPTRCSFNWITKSGNATDIAIRHISSAGVKGTVTSINELLSEDSVVDIYSTSGQLVLSKIKVSVACQQLKKGIYVVNGEKFIVK